MEGFARTIFSERFDEHPKYFFICELFKFDIARVLLLLFSVFFRTCMRTWKKINFGRKRKFSVRVISVM